jgi:membrane protein required for colicin V production
MMMAKWAVASVRAERVVNMDSLPFNITDLVVAAAIVVSGFLAFFRGFFREILSIGSWVGAFFAALHGFPYLRPYIHDVVEVPLLADGLAAGGVFVVALVILSLISRALTAVASVANLGTIDRSLGFLFGAARGAVLVCLSYLMIQWAVDEREYPSWLTEAKSLPMIQEGAVMLMDMVPESLRTDADRAAEAARRNAEEELRRRTLSTLVSPPTKSDAPDKASGYTSGERRDMQRAVQGSQ